MKQKEEKKNSYLPRFVQKYFQATVIYKKKTKLNKNINSNNSLYGFTLLHIFNQIYLNQCSCFNLFTHKMTHWIPSISASNWVCRHLN